MREGVAGGGVERLEMEGQSKREGRRGLARRDDMVLDDLEGSFSEARGRGGDMMGRRGSGDCSRIGLWGEDRSMRDWERPGYVEGWTGVQTDGQTPSSCP